MQTPQPAISYEIKEIIYKALALSEEARLYIADTLWQSANDSERIDPEIEAAWKKEIKRRVEDARAGRVKIIDGDTFLRKVRGQIRK